jgi:hypothetical protein
LSAVLKTQGTAELLLAVPDLEEKPNCTKLFYVTETIKGNNEMKKNLDGATI